MPESDDAWSSQTVERRGFSREIVESLLAAGADRDYFADRERLGSLARTLTTATRTVAVQSDEEHSRFQLQIEDRSTGYPRHHTISVDFIGTPEYRGLLASFHIAWVGIFAPLDVLEAREAGRGDRLIGLARWQFFIFSILSSSLFR